MSIIRSGPPVATPSVNCSITAASGSVTDVQAAINAASDGQTVCIPDWTGDWTSGISTSKQIRIKAVNNGNVNITHRAGGAFLLNMTIGSSFYSGIGGINFLSGYPTATATGSYVHIGGSGKPFLMRDCTFELPNFQLNTAIEWFITGGVMWNCEFNGVGTMCSSGPSFCSSPGSESGSIQIKGNYPWETADTFGTADTNGDINTYLEDNLFYNVGQCPDIDNLGRVVIRYSDYVSSGGLTHGSTSEWAGRHVEIYNCNMTYPDTLRSWGRYFWLRAGTMVVTDCAIQRITGMTWGTHASFQVSVENAKRGSPILDSGTYNGAGGTTEVLTDTTKSWTSNQWSSSAVRNITKGWSGTIASNNATTITTDPNSVSPAHSWTVGDNYSINGGLWPCATTYPAPGGNQATSGSNNGINSMQVGWGHNGTDHVSSPVYIWNNTGTGTASPTIYLSYIDGTPDSCLSGKTTGDFLTQGVDWFVDGTAKPGYTKYTYPHPLRAQFP